jgi:predicted nucleic acid-binding protein
MIAVDTNVLVYAHREDSPFHERARSCLDSLANGRAAWAIPWPCLHEFLSIATHPRIYDPPTPLALALDQIDAWLEAPSLVLLAETDSHWPELRTLVESARVSPGPRYTTRASPPCAGNMASANCGRRIAISVGSLGSTSATHS